MPRILDNISLDLVSALKNTLAGSCSADISVGYFNLRGWRFLDAQMENFPGGEGHCCRLIVGMQRSPQEELRRSLSLLKNGERLSNKEVNRLVRVATGEFREQLQIGAPTDADEKGLRRLSAQLRATKLLVRLYLREPLHVKLYLIHRDDLQGQPGTLDLRSPEHRQGRDRAWSSLAIVHIEITFNIQRRISDWHFAGAESWPELVAIHERWVQDYNEQSHWAHREREDGRRSP